MAKRHKRSNKEIRKPPKAQEGEHQADCADWWPQAQPAPSRAAAKALTAKRAVGTYSIGRSHSMDLNYLLMRHQLSLYRSHHAACIAARRAHRGLATAYAAEIAKARGNVPPMTCGENRGRGMRHR
jgi:hypothetical protein